MWMYWITVVLFVYMQVSVFFVYGSMQGISRTEALQFLQRTNLNGYFESILSTKQRDSVMYKQPAVLSEIVDESLYEIPVIKPKRFFRLSLYRTRGSCNRVPNPCNGRGTCQCTEPNHSCACPAGYTGNCNTDLDECSIGTATCSSDASCSNTFGSYICTCNPGFHGDGTSCQEIDECDSNPCQHGTCNDLVNDYSCTCEDGYDGKNCNNDIDECQSTPCQHGSCNDQVNDYSCTCEAGYSGKDCDIDIDECQSTPCQHGSCNDQVNDYSCTCETGYNGKDCDIDIDECQSAPCQHGSCNDQVNDYSCTCEAGYNGENCDIDIDECQSAPCQHGSCNDQVNDYSCTCEAGYNGENCDIDIDECQSTPCQHGSCNDQVNDYSCTCEAGYSGKNCDIDIDECNSSPCKNGGTCNDHVNRYSCTCSEDYTDINCETDMCYPSQGADIAVLLDTSSSQSEDNFQRQKELTKSLVNAFPIGMDNFRFSVLLVSNFVTIEFGIQSHLTNDSLLQAIDDISPSNGSSNHHQGIKTVRDSIFNDITTTKAKYLIILGDGLYSNPLEIEKETLETKQTGMTMISVGFGTQILQKALIDTATDYKHVFTPTTDDLKNWMLKRHVMDACPDCTSKTSDVFILLETSQDLGYPVFYGLLESFKSLVEKMSISKDRVHVSIATFDSTVSGKFDFSTYYSQQSIITRVMATSRMTRQTSNYVTALQHIKDNAFVSSNGYRHGSRKIAILFMEHTVKDFDTVKEKSDSLKAEDVIIVVITFTLESKPEITDLLEIVSDPAYLFVIGDTVYGGVSAFDALTSLFEYSLCVFD